MKTATPPGATYLVKSILYDKTISLISPLGFIGLFFLIVFGAERSVERVRRANLWKESGFVKPLRWGYSKGLMIVVTVVVLAIIIGSVWLMAMGQLSQDVALHSIPVSASLGTGVIFFSIGYSLTSKKVEECSICRH